jgi:phosphatidylserine decarboxylase
MKPGTLSDRVLSNDAINFALTNRIPRATLTRFMGWFSQIENPIVRDASIAVWKLFANLDLSDARKQEFRSLHDCFIRELLPGARPIDARNNIVVSPCDAIVGTCGTIRGSAVVQAKGRPYLLHELLDDKERDAELDGGIYVTLRLTSSVYHRFHAPHAGHVRRVIYVPGEVWNVNPPTLRRVERVFCRNERAVIDLHLACGDRLTLVPVAAVLVASLRLHFIDVLLHLDYDGPREIACNADFAKGAEMGWFQHGSTILMFAPAGYRLAPGVREGERLCVGMPLMRLPADAHREGT